MRSLLFVLSVLTLLLVPSSARRVHSRAAPRVRAGAMGLLSNVFGSSMVFQLGAPISLWGAAPPGATVQLRMGAANASAVADARGLWRAELPAVATPSSGHVIYVSSDAGANATLTDVSVGTVLLCGGQSNLSGATTPLTYAFNGTESAAEAAAMPWVRLFAVGELATQGLLPPQAQLGFEPRQPWAPASVATASAFSAVCWMTAKEVARALGAAHPLGLIESAWS
jgi:sialate O-acetylesterase